MVLSLVQLIVLVVIAAIAGAVGQSLAGYRRGGFLLSAVIGFIGALLGVWLANQLRLPELIAISVAGVTFPLLWAIIGATILVFLVALIARPGRTYYRRRRRYL